MKRTVPILAILAFSLLQASDYETRLTGPDATGNLLKKQHPPLQGKLTLSADYNALGYLSFGSNADDDTSAANAFRLYGEWSFDQLHGKLVFKTEYRDSFGITAPTDFGFTLGYVGMPHSTFSDQQARLTTLYWKQYLWDNNALLLAGYLDVTEYVDVYLTASPWESFSNLVFATGSGTIGGLPDGALGAMLGGWLNEHWYASIGAADANADAHDPLEGFDTLFNEAELFSSLEIGYVPSKEALFFDNTHITLWHMDAHGTTPKGWGVSASWTKTLDAQTFAFIRGGWSDGGGALLKRSLSIGGAYLTPQKNVIGVGLNVGDPNEESFPGATRTQYTTELFYRWQVDTHLQITPSLQYLYHPAIDTTTDDIILLGLRVRASF